MKCDGRSRLKAFSLLLISGPERGVFVAYAYREEGTESWTSHAEKKPKK
jgi:hypothetical protein